MKNESKIVILNIIALIVITLFITTLTILLAFLPDVLFVLGFAVVICCCVGAGYLLMKFNEFINQKLKT